MRHLALALGFVSSLVLTACSDDAIERGERETGCAGHEELCERRFDEVAFPATHNSMADTDNGRFAANQTHDIAQQLEDGVRGLMLDVHYDVSDPPVAKLCHVLCAGGEPTLEEGLTTIREFLDRHPTQIVTLIFESYASKADVVAAFEGSGATRYVATQALGAPWPTLREMIDTHQRLVVFTDSDASTGADAYAWYMDQWAYAFQNPYAAKTAADFSCSVDRGTAGASSVFIMNHFLTDGTGKLSFATTVNPYAVLEPHVAQCKTERARIPNFVTVDFYEVGDLFRVVDELNGFGASP